MGVPVQEAAFSHGRRAMPRLQLDRAVVRAEVKTVS